MKFEDIDFYSISQDKARELGPFGAKDKPCTVECYGEKRGWKSSKCAAAFYRAGANSCMGSEQERYSRIAAKLEAGKRTADDSCWGWY